MHRFIEQDDTFIYWYDINAIYPIPRGWGIFFWNTPGDPGAGDFKTQNTPGPPGWGIFFSPGVWHLYASLKDFVIFLWFIRNETPDFHDHNGGNLVIKKILKWTNKKGISLQNKTDLEWPLWNVYYSDCSIWSTPGAWATVFADLGVHGPLKFAVYAYYASEFAKPRKCEVTANTEASIIK